jgi:hypothetical protein
MKRCLILLLAFLLSKAAFSQEKMDKMDKTSSHHMSKMHGTMQDCVMMEDGKTMMMKDGKTMPMDQDMTLKNGTMVMTDGTIKWKNGKTMKLKNNQCIYMNGKVSMMKMDKMKGSKSKM